jgi:hypothetical protein
MGRGLAWIGGALGLAALARALRKRQQQPAQPAVEPPAADPAEELRAALDETRAVDDAAGEQADEGEPASLEERRRQVHERAQEALDAMREPPSAS